MWALAAVFSPGTSAGNFRVPISSSASAPRKTLSSKSPTVRTYSSYSLFSALLKEKPRFNTKGLTAEETKVPQEHRYNPKPTQDQSFMLWTAVLLPPPWATCPQPSLPALGPKTSPGSLQESLFHQHLDLSKKREKPTLFSRQLWINQYGSAQLSGFKSAHTEQPRRTAPTPWLDFCVCYSVAHNFPNGAGEGKVRSYLPGFYF